MSVVVAEGVVVVTADAKGVPRKVAKDIDADSDSITKSGKGLGTKLFSGVTSMAGKAIGIIGGAVTALGLYGGFSRALNIQDARASLAGLGHDTESIKTIMSSALAAVKGTAFGMGDAATLAASAVAAGIKPGADLTRTLSLMADAATIGKTSIGEMGSVWNKAATAGKLTTEVMQSFHDKGIPVLTNVAKHYGVTNEAAQKMITDGKVSFAEFETIMEKQLGGAALKGGETARGAFANVGAALGRVFALFATPAVEGAPSLFQGITAALDSLGLALAPVAERFGNWLVPALAKAGEWVSKIDFLKLADQGMQLLKMSPAVAIFEALAPLFPLIADVATQLAPILGNLARLFGGVLLDAIDALLPSFAGVVEALVTSLVPIMPVVAELLESVSAVVLTLADELGRALLPILPVIAEALVALAPVALDLITALLPLVDVGLVLVFALLPLITVAAELAAEVLPSLIDAFITLMPAILSIIDVLVIVLVPAIEILADIIVWLAEFIVVPLFKVIVDAVVWLAEMFAAGFDSTMQGIKFWADIIGTELGRAGSTFTWLYENIVKPVFDLLAIGFNSILDNVIKPVTQAIGVALRMVGNTVQDIFGGISSFIGNAFQSVLSVVRGPLNALIGLINGVIGGLNSVKVTIPDWVPLVGGKTFGVNIPRIPMLARGTNNAPDTFIAGENGPELITGAGGSTVRPYSVTQDLLARRGDEGGITIEGDIIIDAKNVKEFNDVVELIRALPQVSRAGRGSNVGVGA